ncbi:MAG TPA: hypothetical protein VMH85_13135 [Terriglobales bacterium]|nr:hypothetical protein [Terriglobales bacterium]
MNRTRVLIFALALAVPVTPALANPLPSPQEHDHDHQMDRDHGREHAEYHFRQEDAARLREHYHNIQKVDVHHRPAYAVGGYLPADWHHRVHKVPVEVVRELPPPPPGYVFGYMDGYCVAYNPTTRAIADVIDLASLAMR